ncbi:MAG: FAD-dependent oxidoreductase, partial [Crenarchaeota archaeon]|nr:FAD-dependent oxidoreductase [Thermoproteota archaeon]
DLLPEPLGLLRNPTASRKTREILEEMGATLLLGEPVVKVEPRGVTLKSGRRVEADVVVWSAGFRGPGIEAPKEALARGGFLQVDENLRVPGLGGRVLAAGDAAAIADARGCTALKMAREAIRSGAAAAANVAAMLDGGSLEAYRPRLSTCAIQAGLSLGPKRGLLLLGRAVAVESMIPHYYHEHLRRAYQKLLATAGG